MTVSFFLSLSPVKKSRTLKLLSSSTQLERKAYYNSKTRHETESETKTKPETEVEIEFAQTDNQLRPRILSCNHRIKYQSLLNVGLELRLLTRRDKASGRMDDGTNSY